MTYLLYYFMESKDKPGISFFLFFATLEVNSIIPDS